MKKNSFMIMVGLMALLFSVLVCCTEKESRASVNNGNANGTVEEYVDLGLPSGTKWKNVNEVNSATADHDFYTYDEAVAAFGDALPTKEQLQELKDECNWTWAETRYIVVGPNGKSIALPSMGYCAGFGTVLSVGSYGYYWSSTSEGPDNAWDLDFSSNSVYINCGNRGDGGSVRLVQN